MAFARAFACRVRSAAQLRGEGRKGFGKTQFEPRSWEANPPKPLPVSDPVTGWTKDSKRVGAIGFKLGMSTIFDTNYEMQPLSFIMLPDCTVSQVKTVDKEGYSALQVAAGKAKRKNMTKPLLVHLDKAGVGPRKRISEFKVTADALLPVGTQITAKHFVPGQYVDVQGVTKGKGFQGVMKRWGFKGLPASHGVSLTHRSLGATGARQDPGKVWKGKKMPGHMGQQTRTVRNLLVMMVDTRHQVIAVKGSIPGGKGAWLRVTDAAWKPFTVAPPFPTYFPKFGEPGEKLTAVVPPPASWGETDLSLTDTMVENDFPDFDDQDAYVPPEEEEAQRKEAKLKERKGARMKAKKLAKRLVKEGKMAAPAEAAASKAPAKAAKKE